MFRVVVLVLLIVAGFALVYFGLRWLWQTATGEKQEEVEGEKVEPRTWKDRLPQVVLLLFILLGVLLVGDRLFNSEESGVRHYAPATLAPNGTIESGRRY